jgi:dTDP-4-dehydrorhamnose 3,5-epimerase
VIFEETVLPGAYLVSPERREDERGFFARTWDRREFAAQGLASDLAQASISFSTARGTLRGMHWQEAPFAETKLVRCTYGAIHDVIVDLRPESPTYTRWLGVDLTQDNRAMLYVPEGFAHGFISLADATEVTYQMSQVYAPEFARGARHDDPAFSIAWPVEVRVISEKDRGWPDFRLSQGGTTPSCYTRPFSRHSSTLRGEGRSDGRTSAGWYDRGARGGGVR